MVTRRRYRHKISRTSSKCSTLSLTLHSLRSTFASILFAVGEAPPYVMGQIGHTTAELTLRLYAREMDRRDGEPERLRALVNGEDWTVKATGKRREDESRAATSSEASETGRRN